MPEYVPLFKPGQSVTRTTSAAVTGGQLLAVGAGGAVAATSAATAAWFGVAAYNVASGEQVTVHKGGVQRLVAAGAIAAGDIVVPASNGRVATNATPTAGHQVGIALSAAADGALVDVDTVR